MQLFQSSNSVFQATRKGLWKLHRLCVLAAITFAAPMHAAQADCGSFQLAFYELGALYFKTPQGGYAGIDKDVVDELSKRSGCQFQTVLESRVRIWHQMSQQTLDVTVSGIATPEREKFARFIPYFTTRNFLLLSSSAPARAHSPEGFLSEPNLRVAVVKSFRHGALYDTWLAKLREQNRVEEAADFDSVVRLFMAKRVDAFLALPTSLEPLRRKELANSFIVLDWAPFDEVRHGLVLSRNRVPLPVMELMRREIRNMHDDGTLEKIFARYVGAEQAKHLLLKTTE